MKEYYIGLDVHKDSVFMAVLDDRKGLVRLRKEVKTLRTANEMLKKAAVIFAQGDPQ
jgi:transposase-like protein